MKSNTGVVPKLRFPEFRNAGEWEVKRLGDYLSNKPEYGVNAAAVPFNKNLPIYLRITDISEDGKLMLKNRVSIDLDASKEQYLSEDDIVLARTGASVGKSYKYRKSDGALVFAGFLIRIRPNILELDSEFLSQYLHTNTYWNWVEFTSARSGQPGINGTEYSLMPIPLPPTIQEQQKIADCLSSLDEVIDLHTKKLEALKTHKKGLMQQLFPRDGETTPRMRFPEFRDAGEWEVKRIHELLEYERPEPYIVQSDNYEPYGTPVLTANKSFILGYTYEQTGIYEDVPVIIFDDFTTDKKFVDFPFKVKSSAIKILKRKGENNIRFIFELMNLIHFDPQQHKRYYISEYQNIVVRVPIPKEQQKIADCLSSLDEVIDLHTKKLEALKAHKKGLMQQLFPTMDEVRL